MTRLCAAAPRTVSGWARSSSSSVGRARTIWPRCSQSSGIFGTSSARRSHSTARRFGGCRGRTPPGSRRCRFRKTTRAGLSSPLPSRPMRASWRFASCSVTGSTSSSSREVRSRRGSAASCSLATEALSRLNRSQRRSPRSPTRTSRPWMTAAASSRPMKRWRPRRRSRPRPQSSPFRPPPPCGKAKVRSRAPTTSTRSPAPSATASARSSRRSGRSSSRRRPAGTQIASRSSGSRRKSPTVTRRSGRCSSSSATSRTRSSGTRRSRQVALHERAAALRRGPLDSLCPAQPAVIEPKRPCCSSDGPARKYSEFVGPAAEPLPNAIAQRPSITIGAPFA